MIRPKNWSDLPANEQGISAEKKITVTDYEKELIPMLEEKTKANNKFRMVYQLENDFSRFDMRAMLDDAKKTFKNISKWDRIALVSDHVMINSFARFFRHLTTCELRLFKNEELDEAKSWITEE